MNSSGSDKSEPCTAGRQTFANISPKKLLSDSAPSVSLNKMDSQCIICNKPLMQPNSDTLYSTLDSLLPFMEGMEEPITFYEAINLFSNFTDLDIDDTSAIACDSCFMLAKSAVCFQQMCERAYSNIRAYQCNENIQAETKDSIEIIEINPITDSINCKEDSMNEESIEHAKNQQSDITEVKIEEGNSKANVLPKVKVKKKNYYKKEEYYKKKANEIPQEKKTCPICNKKFIPQYFQTHLKRHYTEKSYIECKNCSKMIVKECFIRHTKHFCLKRENRKLPFLCSNCGKRFPFRYQFNEHLLIHLNVNERPHKCEICGAAFITKGHLEEHVARHSAEKSVVCPKCPARFATMKGLGAHKVVHAEVKPHQCSSCLKRFTQRQSLRSHQAKSCPGFRNTVEESVKS